MEQQKPELTQELIDTTFEALAQLELQFRDIMSEGAFLFIVQEYITRDGIREIVNDYRNKLQQSANN